jgi:phosphotransferase system HPr (HPr) family protein
MSEKNQYCATLEIQNKKGLHARAAAAFVKVAEQFDADITVERIGQSVNGCSIMGLMMLAASKGTTIEVKTLHGRVSLKIPSGTQSNTKFKMAGKGIDNATTGRQGHQYVIAKVITPTNLTGEQKDLFNKLSKTDETAGNKFFDRIKKFFKN